jgi:hypothetical protein
VVDEGGSTVVIRDIQYGSGLNQEDLGAFGINRAALEVACPPPEIGAKKFQGSFENTSLLLTEEAVLLSKVLSWISTLAPVPTLIAPP